MTVQLVQDRPMLQQQQQPDETDESADQQHCRTTSATTALSDTYNSATGSSIESSSSSSSSKELPKNNSFNSVTDILQIENADVSGKEVNAVAVVSSQSSTTDFSDKKRSKVQFGTVEVRLYNRMVGDHPDVKVGPPITFGWEYTVLPSFESVDTYEQSKSILSSSTTYYTRPTTGGGGGGGVRKLSSITRKNILRNIFDISEEEILAAEREIQKIQSSRSRSIHQSTIAASMESTLHKIRRKVRQSFRNTIISIAAIPMIVPGATMSSSQYGGM